MESVEELSTLEDFCVSEIDGCREYLKIVRETVENASSLKRETRKEPGIHSLAYVVQWFSRGCY